MTIHTSVLRRNTKPTTISGIAVSAIGQFIDHNRAGTYVDKDLARRALSCESFDEAALAVFDNAHAELTGSLEGLVDSIATAFHIKDKSRILSATMRASAEQAAIAVSDINAVLSNPVFNNKPGSLMATGGLTQRPGIEAYDEKENRNTAVYTVAYNLLAARQDEFAETLFPTVVQAQEQAGFSVSIQLVQVMDELRKGVEGDLIENMGRKNVMKALIDDTILRNDSLRAYPVYRDENKHQFAPESELKPRDIVHEGFPLTTSALLCGKRIDVMAISQTDAMLREGLMDATDAMDTTIVLESLYVSFPDGNDALTQLVKFTDLQFNQSATFSYKPAGDWRDMQMNFDSRYTPLTENIKTVTGAAIDNPALAAAFAAGWVVDIRLSAFGEANLQQTYVEVDGRSISVTRILNKDNELVDLKKDPAAKAVVAAIEKAKIKFWDGEYRRINSNLRERGQLIDTTYQNQLYSVPLLSPVTALRPMTDQGARDASDLTTLLMVTRIRTTNAAVHTLLQTANLLKNYHTRNGVVRHEDTGLLGVTRQLLSPHWDEQEYDVLKEVNTLNTSNRSNDVVMGLSNKIRDMVYTAWVQSGYKAIKEAQDNGIGQLPLVIIATDPMIARYLQVSVYPNFLNHQDQATGASSGTATGNFRLVSDEFVVKIVSSNNLRMKGKLFITFGDPTGAQDGVPNPMGFGNMIWKAEQSIVLPLHRNGSNSKELSVAPSFRHIVHLPILMSIVIKNLSEAMTQSMPLQTKEQP